MPCGVCGNLLCVDPDRENLLLCPRCDLARRVESQPVVGAKTDYLLEEIFTDQNIVEILGDYSKQNLILYLVSRLNHISSIFMQENGMPISEFGYVAYLLRQIYEADDSAFGNEQLENHQELSEEIEVATQAYTELIRPFRNAQNKFSICVRRSGFSGAFEDFVSDYELLQSEYDLCFERCVKSILCGSWDDYEAYSIVADTLRATDRTDVENIGSVQDFADAWYQFIIQLRLLASSDEMVGDTYTTRLPNETTIFELEEFFDLLDERFSEEQHAGMAQEGITCVLSTDEVDRCGREAFDSSWEEIKPHLIISENNQQAHPFLFKLETEEERTLPGFRRPIEVPITRIFYPKYYANVLKFQIFPLLQNGSNPSSHQLLSELTAERGETYERNLYDFLTNRGIECYHSAEISRNDPNEIDLLCVIDDSLLFIEVKYLMPPIKINEPEGVRILNEKFNRLIFNEVSENTTREAEGRPFPDKVQTWRELEPGEDFSHQSGPETEDREFSTIPESWNTLNYQLLVISNVVPSYIEKQDVRFLTDLEFYKWIEHDDESVFYSLR